MITINTSLQFSCSFNGIQMWYHVKWNFFTIFVMHHTEYLIFMKTEWYFIRAIFSIYQQHSFATSFWTTAHNSLKESWILTSNKVLSESNDSNFFIPLHSSLYRTNYDTLKSMDSQSHSSSHICFAWQMANGRDSQSLETTSSDRIFCCRTEKGDLHSLTSAQCLVKLLWMWVLFDSGYDKFKKLKQEEQNFITNCRMVTFAPQWCLTAARLMNW